MAWFRLQAAEQTVHEGRGQVAHAGQERENRRPFIQEGAAIAFGSRQTHGPFEGSQGLRLLSECLLRPCLQNADRDETPLKATVSSITLEISEQRPRLGWPILRQE
jgi:hypothetical protein